MLLSDMRRSTSLRILYLGLGGVALAAAVAAFLYPDVPFIRDFAPNVATESAAIIVTLAFVRTILERQERARRLRSSIGAIRKSRRALGALATMWAEMIKGCLPHAPAERPTSEEELFASHYTEHLTRFDPRAERAEPHGVTTWADWAAERMRKSTTALAEIARDYAAVLDPEYVEVLEALVDDPFSQAVLELIDAGADARTWRFTINLERGTREAHFRAMRLALDYHNRLARQAAAFRSRSLLPRAGALDIDLPVEDDLMLATRLQAAFWKTTPLPGALRTP